VACSAVVDVSPEGVTFLPGFVGKLLEEDDVDLLRDGVRVLAQVVMDAEVSSQIGAVPYERSGARTDRSR
jgi:transposase-like protein